MRSRTTDAEETLTARVLVAADGAASLIRSGLGLRLEGEHDLLHLVNCYFRADIERYIGERKGVLLLASNEQASGVLQPLDGAGRWLCQIGVGPDEHSLEVFTKERPVAARRTCGSAGPTPGSPPWTWSTPASHCWAGPEGGARRSVAADAAAELGVGVDCYVDCHVISGAGLQDRGGFAPAYGLAAGGAVLVRPDGHVAWRHARGPADRAGLAATLRSILAR